MTGNDKERAPRERGRLFFYLEQVMDGRPTDDQRARVESLHARLRVPPTESMYAITAVYELYLHLLGRELADVSRQVRRGMALACAVSVLGSACVSVPCTLFVIGRVDSAKPAEAVARPDACAAGGGAGSLRRRRGDRADPGEGVPRGRRRADASG